MFNLIAITISFAFTQLYNCIQNERRKVQKKEEVQEIELQTITKNEIVWNEETATTEMKETKEVAVQVNIEEERTLEIQISKEVLKSEVPSSSTGNMKEFPRKEKKKNKRKKWTPKPSKQEIVKTISKEKMAIQGIHI